MKKSVNKKKKNNKNSKKIINNKINIILSSILLLFTIIGIYMLFRLNVLNNVYCVLIWIVLLIVNILLFYFKNKITNIIKGVLIVIFGLLIYYIGITFNFIDVIQERLYYKESYYIVVNNDSNINSIDDLNNKNVGTYKENFDVYKDMINEYNLRVNSNLIDYDQVDLMSYNLKHNSIDGMIISGVHKRFLEEEKKDFLDNTKVLDQIDLKVKKDNRVKHSDIDVRKETFNVLILGSDSRGSISSRSNNDVDIVMTVNPYTREIMLTSFPRDSYVYIYGNESCKDKLTHAGYYGNDVSVKTFERLLNTSIDYYVKIGFSTVINLVDSIDGVEIFSDQAFNSYHIKGWKVPYGNIHMNGKQALAFARERYAYSTGDIHRCQNQQDVIKAIVNKFVSNPKYLLKYSSILNSISDTMETNIDMKVIGDLVKLQRSDNKNWTIKTTIISGYGSMGKTYSYPRQDLWIYIVNENSLNKAGNVIKGMKEGKSFNDLGV